MGLTVSIYDLVKALGDFSYTLSASDHVWHILCPGDANRWHHLDVNKYQDTFYIMHVNGNGGSLEVNPEKGVRVQPGSGTSSYLLESRLAGIRGRLSGVAIRRTLT